MKNKKQIILIVLAVLIIFVLLWWWKKSINKSEITIDNTAINMEEPAPIYEDDYNWVPDAITDGTASGMVLEMKFGS